MEEKMEEASGVEEGAGALAPAAGPPSSTSSSPSSEPMEGMPVCLLRGRFLLRRKIGSGSFSNIFSALDVEEDEEVAVKMERRHTGHREQLAHENQVYQIMMGGVGINSVRFYGRVPSFNILVMDMLGPCLADLFNHCDRQFSVKTVLMLADQMISLLEWFHLKNYIHRDIKPENFVMGLGEKSNKVFIIDFGLAKRYRSNEGVIIPFTSNKSMMGTARFVSVNAHMRYEQGRRDDLEALGFMLLFFAKGRLPWQRVRGATKDEQYANIAEMKINSLDTLTEGIPVEFLNYMQYCRCLKYEEAPDYGHLRRLFRRLLQTEYEYDYKFDWVKEKKKKFVRIATMLVTGKEMWKRDANETLQTPGPSEMMTTRSE